MVPVVSNEDGSWLVGDPLQPLMKPGGHGAIWKLMLDEGVFAWLQQHHKREAAIVRQIRCHPYAISLPVRAMCPRISQCAPPCARYVQVW